MPTWYRDKATGKVIKIDGKIAIGEDCCCEDDPTPPPVDCCCPQFVDPVPSMEFTLTGFLVGSVIVPGGLVGPCYIWGPAQLIIDEEKCDGIIPVDAPSVSLECIGSEPLAPPNLVAVLAIPLPDCTIEVSFVSADCGPPFTSVWTYELKEAFLCPCIGEGGTMTINEV